MEYVVRILCNADGDPLTLSCAQHLADGEKISEWVQPVGPFDLDLAGLPAITRWVCREHGQLRLPTD